MFTKALIIGIAASMTLTGDDQCEDTSFRADGSEIGDSYGDFCYEYWGNSHWCGSYNTLEFDNEDMCCACGGGKEKVVEQETPPQEVEEASNEDQQESEESEIEESADDDTAEEVVVSSGLETAEE